MQPVRGKKTSFGKKVKMELIRRDMTSRELAKELGIAESTLCDVLAGRNKSEKTRKKIEEALQNWKTGTSD